MKKRILLLALCMMLMCTFGVNPLLAEKRVVRIAQFPIGPAFWNSKYMIDKGIYKKWGDKIGVEYKISFPGDDFAAFMGRSVDVASFAPLELTRLLADEGKHVVIFGKYITNTIGWYVRGDSPAQSPADLKGKRLGIPGWDTAAAQVGEVIMKELWGINIKKDFKVHVAPWPALPPLLAKGEIDICLNLMPLTMKLWMEGKIRPIWETVCIEYAKHAKGYKSGVQFFCMWKDYLDKNEDVARNLLAAYQEGIYNTYAGTEEWLRKYMPLSVKDLTEEQIKFTTRHYFETGFLYYNTYLDEKFLAQEIEFLKKVEKLGLLPKGSVTRKVFRVLK